MSRGKVSRRDFLRGAGALAAAGTLPISMVELTFGGDKESVHFAYISDSHIQHIEKAKFVRNWDRGLIRGGGGGEPAPAETGLRHVRR